MEYIYDIYLDDELVGDSGDEIFDDETQAKLDAEDYIGNYLTEEYDRPTKDFEMVLLGKDQGEYYTKLYSKYFK